MEKDRAYFDILYQEALKESERLSKKRIDAEKTLKMRHYESGVNDAINDLQRIIHELEEALKNGKLQYKSRKRIDGGSYYESYYDGYVATINSEMVKRGFSVRREGYYDVDFTFYKTTSCCTLL